MVYSLKGALQHTFNIILDSQVKKIDNIRLINKTYELNEFEFSEEEDFNIRKLRAIEGVMITQGKKTEAINGSTPPSTQLSRVRRRSSSGFGEASTRFLG